MKRGHGGRFPVRQTIRWACLCIGFVFMIKLLNDGAPHVVNLFEKFDPILLMLAAIFGLLANVLVAVMFYFLMCRYGYTGGFISAMRTFLFGQIAKYTPGKLWVLWVQADRLAAPRPWRTVLLTNVDFAILTVIAALTSVGIGMQIQLPLLCAIILVAGCAAGMVFARAAWIVDLIGRCLRRSQADLMPVVPNMRFYNLEVAILVGVQTLFCVFAMMLMLQACFRLTYAEAGVVMAQLSFAWIVGALTFVVPGGVGVREAAFMWIGSHSDPTVSWSMLTAIAVVSRLWLTLLDLLTSVIGVSVLAFRRNQ